MTHRAAISINLGAGTPIEVVRQIIDDFDSVCSLAVRRNTEPQSPRQKQRYSAAQPFRARTTTTVESIRYSNPLEIVFVIGVVGLLALQTIRDWSGRRRVNAAVAADVENTVNARTILRDDLTRRFLDSDVPVSPQLLDDLSPLT